MMVKKSYSNNKKSLKYNSSFYNRQLNKIIFVLILLIFIFMIKIMNTTSTKNIIEIIETNINYNFSLKSDGKKSVEYIKKLIVRTKDSIEIFNINPNNSILNN